MLHDAYREDMVKIVLIYVLRAYQLLLSPWLGNNCRFHPRCSDYAAEAIDQHGCVTGFFLTAKRLGRCHPWHAGGVDPVPPACPDSH